MDFIHIHLVVVHLPIVGLMFTILLLLCAHIFKEEILFKISYSFLLLCAFFAIIAYVSGPLAYEAGQHLESESEYVENHAILGKICFLAIIILGVISFSALASYFQEEKPSSMHRYIILFAAIVIFFFLGWTANLGAKIRHEHMRKVNIFGLFSEEKK